MPTDNINPVTSTGGGNQRNFFTNENPKKAVNTSGTFGIIPHSVNPTNIDDGLTGSGASLVKMGSSIPSPLARLFIFSAALRELNDLENKHQGTGHIGKPDDNGACVLTPYHELIGEMLDMLEFIYKYGDDPDFEVIEWNMDKECTLLENSGVPQHLRLASALRSAFQFGVLNGHPIYLFRWKGKVIGGSSPITLVYTSANLARTLQQLGENFNGDAGNSLFTFSATPLHERDKGFQEYLFRLNFNYLSKLSPSSPLNELQKYIESAGSNYNQDLYAHVQVDPRNWGNLKTLQLNPGNSVSIGGVNLYVSDHTVVINPSTSDYILKPSASLKKGEKLMPLVLTRYGMEGLKYAAGREWNPNSDRIQAIIPDKIENRTLPGFSRDVKYPYLTESDFFEDKLIEVSYGINREKFFTGSKEAMRYLLPLKKIFFEYFRLSDLVDGDGNYTDMLVMNHEEDRERLTVKLRLPLVNGHHITLQKTYSTPEKSEDVLNCDVLNCYDGGNTFDLAFFPFYRLEPDSSNNVYNIMVARSVKDIKMKFYEPSGEVGKKAAEVESIVKARTLKRPGQNLATDHVRVNEAFSFAELTVEESEEVTALIIPLFKIINSDRTLAQQNFYFSIDFGTTNTHVAYAAVSDNVVGPNQVEPFNYDEDDSQLVVFNDLDGPREFGIFTTTVKREFVPPVLGNEIKFPIRTATCQVAGKPNKLEMFFSSNIGFNYSDEFGKPVNYKTNLKWDRYDQNANDRMSSFFTQILWMMKNKSVLNDGSDKFTLVVTYPISMRSNDLRQFKNAWEKAKRDVQCEVTIEYRTESVAPYYSYLVDLQYEDPYVNMDIGGGTTDILYVDPFSQEANVFSVFFAANDLWNDGVDPVNRTQKANGFVEFYKSVRGEIVGSGNFNDIYKNANSSEDIISHLFAKDEEWSSLSKKISASKTMMQLPILHFSSLIFYLAYVLHTGEHEVPVNISFTGMGSKYIQLISDKEQISKLVNAIIHYAGRVLNNPELEKSNVKVHFAENPKALTATGALISYNYRKPITPSEDILMGYENEDTERGIRYEDLTPKVEREVLDLFKKFTSMFNDEEVKSVLSDDIEYKVEAKVISMLDQQAAKSFQKLKSFSMGNQDPQDKIKEPIFFWPLKQSLYNIGKSLVPSAVDEIKKK